MPFVTGAGAARWTRCSTGSMLAWLTLRPDFRCQYQTRHDVACPVPRGSRTGHAGLWLRPADQGARRSLASRGSEGLLHLGHDVLDQLNGLGLPLGVRKREAGLLHRLRRGPQRLLDPARVAGLLLGESRQERVSRIL